LALLAKHAPLDEARALDERVVWLGTSASHPDEVVADEVRQIESGSNS